MLHGNLVEVTEIEQQINKYESIFLQKTLANWQNLKKTLQSLHESQSQWDLTEMDFFSPGPKIKNIKKLETLSSLGLSLGLFLSLQSSTFLGCSEFLCVPPRLVMAAFS